MGRPGRWRLVVSGHGAPAWNLALDDALLALAREGDVPTLRLYAWQPHALSLGRFQDAAPSTLHLAPGTAEIVRRPTGGGAILHADEVTYSVVVPGGHPLFPKDPMEGYSRFHAPLVRALRGLGAVVRDRGGDAPPHARPSGFFCFEEAASCDVIAGTGEKLLGSAQRRTRTGFLQHGSLPLDGSAGARFGATSLSAACGRRVDRREAEAAIVTAFEETLDLAFDLAEPTAAELAFAEDRVARRYGTEAWTRRGIDASRRAGARPGAR
jgi:lipoyl(octanoyl) transferase